MSKIVIIAGNPNAGSRLNGLTQYVESKWKGAGFEVDTVRVAELPADALLHAQFKNETLLAAISAVEQADGVVIAGPVYKASYSGLLKSFLDVLPQSGLQGKIALPLFIGGSLAHLLSVEYALKPVISALGGRHILGGVYAVDHWIEKLEDGGFDLSDELRTRLDRAADEFAEELRWLALRKSRQAAGIA